MVIQTNIPALYALREKKNTDSAIGKNLEKLSSGFRIRHAADDAAGLMMENIKNDILNQSQQSIIAQAGKRSGFVLQLLH